MEIVETCLKPLTAQHASGVGRGTGSSRRGVLQGQCSSIYSEVSQICSLFFHFSRFAVSPHKISQKMLMTESESTQAMENKLNSKTSRVESRVKSAAVVAAAAHVACNRLTLKQLGGLPVRLIMHFSQCCWLCWSRCRCRCCCWCG